MPCSGGEDLWDRAFLLELEESKNITDDLPLVPYSQQALKEKYEKTNLDNTPGHQFHHQQL